MLYVFLLLTVIAPDLVQSTKCTFDRPCMARYPTHYYNSGPIDEPPPVDIVLCTCPFTACPSDWSSQNNRLHIIRAKVIHPSANVSAELMFCPATSSHTPTCVFNQTAVEMWGQNIPELLKHTYCICPDTKPMTYISQQWAASGASYISYICDSHKIICADLNSLCYSGRAQTYPCECPSGFKCSAIDGNNIGTCIAV